MSADNIHKILEPYLAAIALLVLVLAVASFLLKRHGDRARRSGTAAEREKDRQGGLF